MRACLLVYDLVQAQLERKKVERHATQLDSGLVPGGLFLLHFFGGGGGGDGGRVAICKQRCFGCTLEKGEVAYF
jgi:hypothetical protein